MCEEDKKKYREYSKECIKQMNKLGQDIAELISKSKTTIPLDLCVLDQIRTSLEAGIAIRKEYENQKEDEKCNQESGLE